MRRVFVLLLLGACSSSSTPVPGVYLAPGVQVPGMPAQYVAPGMPGAPMPGTPPVYGQPGMPGVAPGVPAGTPVLAPAAAPAIPPGFRQISGAGFTFAVPASWIDIPPPLPQVVVAVRDTTQLGSLYLNANVVTEPFPGDGTSYTAANVAGLGSAAMILAQRPVSVGGKVGGDIEARWSNATPNYRTLQRLTSSNGTGYVLTCTADDAMFEQARGICAAVLDSFRVMP